MREKGMTKDYIQKMLNCGIVFEEDTVETEKPKVKAPLDIDCGQIDPNAQVAEVQEYFPFKPEKAEFLIQKDDPLCKSLIDTIEFQEDQYKKELSEEFDKKRALHMHIHGKSGCGKQPVESAA
jgi:hypothetical protein